MLIKAGSITKIYADAPSIKLSPDEDYVSIWTAAKREGIFNHLTAGRGSVCLKSGTQVSLVYPEAIHEPYYNYCIVESSGDYYLGWIGLDLVPALEALATAAEISEDQD